jgi:UDP-N-acetylglucosamine enolpyruvyl transferase
MEFGNVYAKKFGAMGESLKGIIFGEQYFFRVSNDAALMITLEEISVGETRLEIIACAAGKGLLGISYGAHATYVHNVEDVLRSQGFSVVPEKEISYFDRNSPLT